VLCNKWNGHLQNLPETCILGNTNTIDDLVKLKLMESYCLPILTCASVALKLSNAQVDELNSSWNSVYRRIFKFNRWESVRGFINGLGRLDFTHLRMYLRLKFCSSQLSSSNETHSFIMKLYYLSDCFKLLCNDANLTVTDCFTFSSLPIWGLRRAVHCVFASS